MFIELVDSLRCIREHEDTWLVASADEMHGRDIWRGVLGCPICGAEYPIAEGVAYFDAETSTAGPKAVRTERAAPAPPPGSSVVPADPASAVLRCAALLGLTDAGGFAVLAGAWGAHAAGIRRLAQVHLLLVNAPPVEPEEGAISFLRAGSVLPLARGTARGAALDESSATSLDIDSVVRSLRQRARLLAPSSTPVPEGISELARDADAWVGERVAAPSGPVVKLERRQGT